jgi:xanthine dehydrogenase accessory factor
VVATVFRTEPPTSAKAGDRAIIDEEGIVAGWVGGGCVVPAVTNNAKEALKDGHTRLIRVSRDLEDLETGIMGYPMTCQSGGTLDIFIEPVMPKTQLVIVGKTAIAKTLCTLAAELDHDVTVAAPGGNPIDFKAAKKWLENLDDIEQIKPAPNSIVIATQGAGDAQALEAALNSKATYIGLIASPNKTARLKETLKKRGCEAAAVDAIDAPAGMNIGAVTPEEVAVSILAELVQRKRRQSQNESAASNEQTRAS